jgi:hypothetical protein
VDIMFLSVLSNKGYFENFSLMNWKLWLDLWTM